jgi:Gpi18-like mannosyltransferase
MLAVVGILTHLVSPGRVAYFAKPGWYFSLYFNWDSDYFAAIARTGYFGAGSLQRWQAFFPGYPAVARAVATLGWGWHPTLGEIQVSLWLVAAVSSAVAVVLLWRLVEEDHGQRLATAAVILFVFGPYSVFLATSYSESLYLACAIGAWWAVRRDRWVVGGLLAGAASFTRINGAILVVALLVLFALRQRIRERRYIGRSVALAALGLSGVGLYFGYLFAITGNPRAWFAAEAIGWNRALNWPWVTFSHTLNRALYSLDPDHRFQSSLDIIAAALSVVAVVVLARNRDWPAAVLVAATLATLMTSYSYLSLGRDTLVLFPFTILLAGSLRSRRWSWVYFAYLATGLVILVINAHEFTLRHWTD